MACGISDARLVFPEMGYGVELAPYKLDIRVDRDKFDHCRARLSREAGQLLADKSSGDPNQPADIYVDGGDRLLRRMYLPDNAIEFGDEEAWIKLMDPLHVLTNGVVDKTYDTEVTLEDVLDYIMGRKIDNNDVIEDYDIADPEYSDEIQPEYEELRNESLFKLTADYTRDLNESVDLSYLEMQADTLDGIGTAVLWTNVQVNRLIGVWGDTGRLDFDQVTPYQALQMVADEWELDIWVDQDRKLWIGKREARPTIHLSTPNPKTLAVSEYNVTEAAFPVAEVLVKGGNARLSINADGYIGDALEPTTNGVKTWGQARVDDIANGRTVTIKNKKLHDGEALEKAATQRLITEMQQNKSGNIVINADASGYSMFANPQGLNIGDYIIVQTPDREHCKNKYMEGGRFVINGMQHKMDGENGWQITLQVGYIPDGQINSRFFYYKPETGEIVDEDQLYLHTGPDPEIEPDF